MDAHPDTTQEPQLPAVEIETGPQPVRTVIWLHGLGADGHDFEPVVGEFDRHRLPPTRFVFPHAPMRAVTNNAGHVMPAWYDILSMDFSDRREDEDGVRQSARQIEALLARENARGIEDRHIVLAGFSQGGAIALHTALRHPRRLAGLMALSTYLPLAATLTAEVDGANSDIPVFMAHGENDPVIPCELGQRSAEKLRSMAYPVQWRTYPMEHSVSIEEIRDIETWLREVLAEPTANAAT